MATISGRIRHQRRLRRMQSPAFKQGVYSAVYAAADLIRTEAALSIVRGAIQGAGHIPSRPGRPPNRDTAQLDTSIHVRGRPERVRADVIADAPHAVFQELGTSKMAERPFMRPATKKHRRDALRLVRAAVQRASSDIP